MQEEKRDSEKYQKYILKFDRHYTTLKSYCVVIVEDENMKEYQLILPNYEMQKINDIINDRA